MITTGIQNILKRKCDGKPISFLKLTPVLIMMACIGLPISILELRADTPTENSISSKKDSEQGNPQAGQQVRVTMKFLEVDSKNLEELSKKLLGTGSKNELLQPVPVIKTMQGTFPVSSQLNISHGISIMSKEGSKNELLQPVPMVKTMQGKSPESSQLNISQGISIMSKEESNVFIRKLSEHKDSVSVSAPIRTVLTGETAKVKIGQEYLYPSCDLSEENKLHFDGTTAEKTIGLTAEVTPRVSEKGTLSLDFMIEVNQFEGMLSHEEFKNEGMTITYADNYEKTFPIFKGGISPIFSTERVESKVESLKEGSVIHLVKPMIDANIPISNRITYNKTTASTLDPLPENPENTAIIDKHILHVIELKII